MKQNLQDAVKMIYMGDSKPVALLDLRFNIIWANKPEFFCENFCLLSVTEEIYDFPIKQEMVVSCNLNGKPQTAEIKPLTDGNEIEGYVVSFSNAERIMAEVMKSDIGDAVRRVIYSAQGELNRIVSAAIILDRNANDRLDSNNKELVERQLYCADKMLSSFSNVLSVFDNNVVRPQQNLININHMFNTVYTELSRILAPIDRIIEFSAPDDEGYVNIDEKRLTLAIVNLMQNALLYSEPATSIGMKMSFEKGNAVIEITNTGKANIDSDYSERAGIGLYVCKQIVESANGHVVFLGNNSIFRTVISLPLISGYAEAVLKSTFTDYVFDNYKPVHTFLNEIVVNEKKV